MSKPIPLPRGGVISVPNMRVPLQGSQAVAYLLDFADGVDLDGDLQHVMSGGNFDYVQSVYIDNHDNTGELRLTFPGPVPYVIVAQPYSQGFYPVTLSQGDGRFVARANEGEEIPIIFYNIPLPYFVWGPTDGVLVTPTLTNSALKITPLAIGDNVLVAAVVGQRVKLYRGIFSVDAPALLQFTDGPAGTLLFAAQLTAGGSLTFQASGVPWITGTAGKSLVVTSDAAVNAYGGYGYVQS